MQDTATPGPSAPRAQPRPHNITIHGMAHADDYAWLRADNWREVMKDPSVLDADIRAYLEAENAYTAAVMADTEALQAALFAEMRGRIKEDDDTVPAPDGPWDYFVRYVEGGEHPVFCRQPRGGGETQRLIDGNALAAGKPFFQLGGVDHSPDHSLVAYGTDDKGSEFYTVQLRDVASGTDLPDAITDTSGGVEWADARRFYYVRLDENHRPLRVFRHVLSTPAEADTLVYEEHDEGFYVGVGSSQSRRFIIIQTGDHQTSEIRLIDTTAPDAEPVLVAAREPGHEYSIEHWGDELLILTNEGGAEDFKIMTAPVDAPGRENWRELIQHKEGRLILGMTAFRDYFVRLEREDGLPRIVIRARDGSEHAIAFDEDAYALGMSGGYEYDTTSLRFTYSSMTTPAQVFDYDMATRTRTLRKTQEVPSGHEPADYRTRRIFAPAPDGETVPISLLWHKNTPLDGSAPVLLYGYGAYGIAMPAGFGTARLSLVDRGFIHAIAHIRGGKDKGYRWYRLGRGAHKTNTFTDFIAAGEHLAAERYTTRGNIVAQGGSAGGMLMGAVANMAPDLFRGIIAEVPFVDVLNTMLDASLPLTPPEWPEWGNPIESADDYRQIAAYSPYDNVRAGAYPHILALGGLTDPRVTYWEPAKWVAKLRAMKTGDNLLLLKTNMEAGHGGASGRFERLKEVALAFAFALKITGKA
jgi:oligopeptidase B